MQLHWSRTKAKKKKREFQIEGETKDKIGFAKEVGVCKIMSPVTQIFEFP